MFKSNVSHYQRVDLWSLGIDLLESTMHAANSNSLVENLILYIWLLILTTVSCDNRIAKLVISEWEFRDPKMEVC